MTKRAYRQWTTTEVREFRPDRSAAEIASIIRRPAGAVATYAHTHGIVLHKPHARIATPQGYSEIRERVLQMKGSLDKVANKAGVHRSTVYRWRKSAGQLRRQA